MSVDLSIYKTKKASQALSEVIKKSQEELTAKDKALTLLESQVKTQRDVVARLKAQLEGYEEAHGKLINEGM
ncbi:hypothetical protein DRO66_09420 [Candidatus Bathyarchaeota archaeon]|nr:MAG: hypothetical protein DRO66_09420 [Candidatus Bathyarchaeota archaeon]